MRDLYFIRNRPQDVGRLWKLYWEKAGERLGRERWRRALHIQIFKVTAKLKMLVIS